MDALHLPQSKKKAKAEGAVIVFKDEASFRQPPTLHATWARRGSQPRIPTRDERHTQKIFGAVRLDNAPFIYLHQQDYFSGRDLSGLPGASGGSLLLPAPSPHLSDPRQRLLSQEAGNLDWFRANRRYVEVFQLPPYWPELKATERIWNYTRKQVTHNRFFDPPQDLCDALFRQFDYVRHHPQEIENLLHPFFDRHVELFMRGYISAGLRSRRF